MAKVTSKFQVTVPKAIAEKYKIRPGDEIHWVEAGEVIRVIPSGKGRVTSDRQLRVRLFDQATERQRKRPSQKNEESPLDRGWTREDLYSRGRAH